MASARKKPEPTPTRYYVEWHPTTEIEAECIKQGMVPDDGTSFWDWVEIYDHVQQRVFRDFNEAVKFALSIASQDCFGGARIYRQTQTVVRDGKRVYIQWNDECFWDGINGTDAPAESYPDEWCSP